MAFIDYVRRQEARMFPEFSGTNIYVKDGYTYFAPSWHFGTGLLTEEQAEEIRAGKKSLLSVGAGPAYLERFITDAMGAKRDQVALCDEQNTMPPGFETHIFNMYRKWPELGRRFDIAIFPESLFTSGFTTKEEKIGAAYTAIAGALDATTENGIVRIDGPCRGDEFVLRVRDELRRSHGNVDVRYADRLISAERAAHASY